MTALTRTKRLFVSRAMTSARLVLPQTGRAVKQQAAEAVAGDQPRQQVALLQDVFLADDFAKGLRPHPAPPAAGGRPASRAAT